jgi:hypothetical protein
MQAQVTSRPETHTAVLLLPLKDPLLFGILAQTNLFVVLKGIFLRGIGLVDFERMLETNLSGAPVASR